MVRIAAALVFALAAFGGADANAKKDKVVEDANAHLNTLVEKRKIHGRELQIVVSGMERQSCQPKTGVTKECDNFITELRRDNPNKANPYEDMNELEIFDYEISHVGTGCMQTFDGKQERDAACSCEDAITVVAKVQVYDLCVLDLQYKRAAANIQSEFYDGTLTQQQYDVENFEIEDMIDRIGQETAVMVDCKFDRLVAKECQIEGMLDDDDSTLGSDGPGKKSSSGAAQLKSCLTGALAGIAGLGMMFY